MIPGRKLPTLFHFTVTLFLSVLAAPADVTLPALFSDNMVLQQGIRLPVWGWADEGERITVSFRGTILYATARGANGS